MGVPRAAARATPWLVAAAVLGGRAVRAQVRSAAALFAVAALACVVLGREEISWGQRILGFGTPDVLSEANTQGEANLHNVATDKLEVAFYSVTCLWFVAVGLVRKQLRTHDEHPFAAAFPPLAVLLTFAPAAAPRRGCTRRGCAPPKGRDAPVPRVVGSRGADSHRRSVRS